MKTPDPHVAAAPAGGAEPDILTVCLVAIITALCVVIAIFGVETIYYELAARENEVKVVAGKSPDLEAYRMEQQHQLEEYRYVDREKGIVAIPIERAMELMAPDGSPSDSEGPSCCAVK